MIREKVIVFIRTLQWKCVHFYFAYVLVSQQRYKKFFNKLLIYELINIHLIDFPYSKQFPFPIGLREDQWDGKVGR